MQPAKTIVCVDCGGQAHLMHEYPVEDLPRPGDIIVYRCEECLDRWDIVVDDEDAAPAE